MKRLAPHALAAALAALAAPAFAQVGNPERIPPGAATAQVSVTYGAPLAGMLKRYGESEVADLAAILQRKVELSAARGGFTRAEIVLEDARPNRPTLEQQSRIPGLSMRSIALGGATIRGVLYRADGASQPLTFSWYESDISREFGATTWYDAERAFDILGSELSRGRVSARLGPGTPGPYSCQGAFDVWCRG